MKLEQFTELIAPFTMTSSERMSGLFYALEYVVANKIDGDLVECGVWKGGNILGMCEFLYQNNIDSRMVWAYDTFSGMISPTDNDQISGDYPMCNISLDEVISNISNTNFNKENIRYIVGDVCKTLDDHKNLPNKIAILRLDTDWYDSTKKELEVFWDRLSENAVLIIDDYGHWQGAKKATDDFLKSLSNKQTIIQLDYTGRLIYKNGKG